MAIFHLSVKTVSRSAGRSATAAAAYRAGVEITDDRTGEVHDYRRKSGIESVELFLPAGSPEWAKDRAELWNAAEKSETRKNSTVAREFEVALPAEISADQRRQLAHDFTKALVKKYGFAADCAIHLPGKEGDSKNHHAHILCSTRKLTPEGFTIKTRELDDRATGAEQVVEVRELFAAMTNKALEKAGHSARVDHRSLVAQGIDDDEPGIHLGPAATAIERRGEVSEKTQHHQERQQEAAGKVAAMFAIAQAQAKAADQARAAAEAAQAQAQAERLAIGTKLAEEAKEKEDDRIREKALGALGKSSAASGRAHAFTVADHNGIADHLRAASGDLGRAIQGAQRRVVERHYGRVVEAARIQFERAGRVIQQVADRVGNVVRTVAAAAQQVAQQVAARLERVERASQAVKAGVAGSRAKFEQRKAMEAGVLQARQAFEKKKADVQAMARQKLEAAKAAKQPEQRTERPQSQPKRDNESDFSR